MTFSEYYDECLSIARSYASGSHAMELDFWQFLLLLPARRQFFIEAVKNCGARGFRYTLSRCTSNRSMVAITSSGDVAPCMQMSGWMEARGFDGEDLSKCIFFDGPWEREIVAALDGWKHLTP